MNLKYVVVVGLAILTACQERNQKGNVPVANNNKPDLLASHINDSIKPGDDFFYYANGKWFNEHPIPASENGWGIFSLVEDENKTRVRKLSEEASASNGKKGSNAQLIGDFFSSGMDSVGIEKLGITAIKPELDMVAAIKTPADVLATIVAFHKQGIGCAYSFYVGQDMKNSNKNMLYLNQGGISLPDRDYYFNTDEQTTKIRNAFPIFIAKMLRKDIYDSVKGTQMAVEIYNMEKELATISRKMEVLRDPQKNYNKMDMASLQKLTPAIDWKKNFANYGATPDSIIVGQPEFFVKLNTLLQTKSVDVWKAYLNWNLISSAASNLNSYYANNNFEFNGTLMNGTKEQRPRWKRVLDEQENALGDALGQLYVKEYFAEDTKKRYVDLTNKIAETYKEHIEKLPWMSDSTKQKAIKKLNTIVKKVGYPDTWKDYSTMNITRDNYTRNIINSNKWKYQFELNKLNKPVDRTEWGMTPQTYNAYYNSSNNEIVLPAAMFTAPGYLDKELDDALVYGYVGASTIGHELTHGFDDEGRQFDEVGNLKNWWSKDDATKFSKKANALVDQFNKFTVLGNKHPNGAASLGENIADLGGVVIGYDAFKKTKQFQENKKIGGLTPTQRYFLGYAYGWMQVRRPEMVAKLLLSDVHAPINLRVNGPFANCDAWYQAFNVQKGDKLWRDSLDRVRIW
jgi:putative endopeptidase